jgi:hypothetical protein
MHIISISVIVIMHTVIMHIIMHIIPVVIIRQINHINIRVIHIIMHIKTGPVVINHMFIYAYQY